eukprot:PITA_10417
MLKTLVPGWVFSAIDASGHSGGLAIGCKEGRIKVINQWGSKNALGMEVLTPVSPRTFTILNIYGPCQGRESFWLDMMAKSFMKASMLIVGGDLNFTMGRAETWGPTAREDPLTDFFHKLIEDHHLADPHPIKLKPTWRNRRVGEDRIAKRLDRFLLSEDLISNAPIIRQWVEEIGNSDHFPIFLDCAIPPPKPPAPFKFNPAWLQDPTFVAIFKNTWLHTNSSSREDKGFLFMENLKRLKKATVIWAKERRLKQNEVLRKIREELELLESPEEDGYQSQSTKDRILQLEKGQNKILLDKEEEWRIKSRAIWLKSGDENTRFFHNYAKGRKSANTIWSLKDEEGSEVSSFTKLASLGKRHFERIFADSGEASIAQVLRTAQCFPRFVEEEEAEDLSRPVSKEEVEAAMKIMAKDKSPGPDGWTIELFLFFFDVIGSEITDVIEESRMKGEVYRPFNATFIALIPKKEDPGIFEDFRPISLCNCIYKIIAKVIAIRIFPFLSKNISSEQFGFLDGRQIHEAIGVAQEVIHSVRQKKKKGAVLKIDLSKAFDRVSWLYLRMMLTHLGFNYTFTSWIMGCISSVSFAVLINGSASTFFNSQRGLRQGCPLSPLLFLLVAEGLSRLIHKARREGKVKGIEVAINLFISHLLFVDDILIFTNGSSNEIKEYKSIFDLFLIATGMEINTRKSQICVADLARREIDSISNIFTFPIQPLDTPFKYLGFWLKPVAYKKEDWHWLTAKIEARINHWSFRWLSRAGRLTLLKSVLLAIPVYWAALTWVPKSVLEKIRKICCRFLWAGMAKDSPSLPWVAWDKIARPKEWGGWGIKRLPEFSMSLAAKSRWRLITRENLWTKVVRRKYIDPIPLEDWIRSQQKNQKNISVIWKATLEAFTVIEQGLAWKVGDGSHIRIGRDRGWDAVKLIIYPRDFLDTWTAKALSLLIRWKNEWASFIQELHRSHVRLKEGNDKLIWALGKTGEYHPKEGYTFLMNQKGWDIPEWWSKSLWKLTSPAKARLFLWCMLKGKIPTWDRLQTRYLIGPGRCPLCKSEEESIRHLFSYCTVSLKIRDELTGLLNIKAQWGSAPLDVAWKNWWQNHPDGSMRNLPVIFFWGVWLARNNSIFQDKSTPTGVIAQNCAVIYSTIPAPEVKSKPTRDKHYTIREGIPWAFFDGASQNNRVGAGMSIHLSVDHYLKASVGLGSGTNNFAELSALHLLLCWLLQRNIPSIQIFGDSQNVINWVNGNSLCHSQTLNPLLEEIILLKSPFTSFHICHIFRENNVEADLLSKTGLQQILGEWMTEEFYLGQQDFSVQPPFAPPS